eukprot:2375163-Rhodomonas_salina.1
MAVRPFMAVAFSSFEAAVLTFVAQLALPCSHSACDADIYGCGASMFFGVVLPLMTQIIVLPFMVASPPFKAAALTYVVLSRLLLVFDIPGPIHVRVTEFLRLSHGCPDSESAAPATPSLSQPQAV